jgi:tartrate-resistant acid phosphatase type 5
MHDSTASHFLKLIALTFAAATFIASCAKQAETDTAMIGVKGDLNEITFERDATDPNPEPVALRVLAFGDAGTGSSDQYEVAETMRRVCQKKPCDMAVMLGDNFYENGVINISDNQFLIKFEKPYGPLGITIYPISGNHDGRGNIESQVGYSNRSTYWKMPHQYYEYTVGSVHFFAIDSNTFSNNSAQREWLANSLKNSTAKWKIVYGHHPIRSGGKHGDSPELIENLEPLLCQYADMYLAGHDHDLQYLKSDCGLPLVVSGAAAKSEKTTTGPYTLFSRGREYFSGFLGFAVLEIGTKQIRVRYYDRRGTVVYTGTSGDRTIAHQTASR